MVAYEVAEGMTLLEALQFIKTTKDATLTFNHGCRSEVCGSCAMRVNDKEVLACGYRLKEGDVITPLDKMPIVKDLVVEHAKAQETLSRVKGWFAQPTSIITQSKAEEKGIERQTDCILCASCFSSCPVLEVDAHFLGPFALTRAYRYSNDSRNEEIKEIIDAVQEKGVWDCTLCGECTMACPQGIDPKNDIMMLRMKSVQQGYSDPTFASGGFDGGDDFLGGGFNPDF
jgi:fumarate reductase iron-sulfur subunit